MTTSMVAEEEADSADSPVGAVATLDAAGHVSSCRGGGSLVVFAVLYSAVARAKGTMGFPYLRTTIDCMELLPDPLLEPAATAPLPVATGIPGHWEPPRACNSSGCVPQRQPSVPRGNASAGLVPAWVGGDWDGSSDGSTPDTAGLPAEVEDVLTAGVPTSSELVGAGGIAMVLPASGVGSIFVGHGTNRSRGDSQSSRSRTHRAADPSADGGGSAAPAPIAAPAPAAMHGHGAGKPSSWSRMGSSAEWDRGASDWSGSDLCASRQLVAQRAQLLRGLADGVGLVAHMTALPLLGLLADAYGRQRICMLAAMGLTLQCALLYLASTAPTAAAVLPCVFAGEVVHGLRCALPLRPTPSLLSAVCQT
jgi:hypothetical protein